MAHDVGGRILFFLTIFSIFLLFFSSFFFEKIVFYFLLFFSFFLKKLFLFSVHFCTSHKNT